MATAPRTQQRRTPIGGVVLAVLGSILGLVALAVLAGGSAVLWATHTQRDAQGYFTTGPHTVFSSSYAITHGGAKIVGVRHASDIGKLAKIRIRATGPAGRTLFLGIGPTSAVDAYLAGVPHSEVKDFRLTPFRPTYEQVGGTARPRPPRAEPFWVASATGNPATLNWRVQRGKWSVVAMNADASRSVVARLTLGADISYLGWLAGGLLAGGGLLLGLGVLLLVFGVLRFRDHPVAEEEEETDAEYEPARPSVYPAHLDARFDEPLGRGLWLVKWLLLIPHLFVLAFLWAAFLAATVGAWFAILFTGRYPRGLFHFNLGVLRWTWRVGYYSYAALGTDRYPPFSLGGEPDYPATLDVEYPARELSRKTTFFRLVLAVPQLLVFGVLTGSGTWALTTAHLHVAGGLIGVLVLFAGFGLLLFNRYPAGLFDFLMGLNRWVLRVVAYTSLMTDVYPPFRLDQGPDEPQPQPKSM